MALAKVVFPTWRGPSNATAGERARASERSWAARRGIITLQNRHYLPNLQGQFWGADEGM
jgi:hypothetical protein